MLKNLIKKIVYREKADSESYVAWLRKQGAKVGERVNVFVPTKTTIDMTRPWLIDIGDDVQITEGVTILTHGYDWSVLKKVYGEILGSSGGVVIGNNVFIGMNATILKGVHIGNNVIIGANSLVNKNIPDNVVVAGNPCRIIMTLDDYYQKRKESQISEARELVYKYRERYGKEPSPTVLREFFWLFAKEELPTCYDEMQSLCGNYEDSMILLKKKEKEYKGIDDFLNRI